MSKNGASATSGKSLVQKWSKVTTCLCAKRPLLELGGGMFPQRPSQKPFCSSLSAQFADVEKRQTPSTVKIALWVWSFPTKKFSSQLVQWVVLFWVKVSSFKGREIIASLWTCSKNLDCLLTRLSKEQKTPECVTETAKTQAWKTHACLQPYFQYHTRYDSYQLYTEFQNHEWSRICLIDTTNKCNQVAEAVLTNIPVWPWIHMVLSVR